MVVVSCTCNWVALMIKIVKACFVERNVDIVVYVRRERVKFNDKLICNMCIRTRVQMDEKMVVIWVTYL